MTSLLDQIRDCKNDLGKLEQVLLNEVKKGESSSSYQQAIEFLSSFYTTDLPNPEKAKELCEIGIRLGSSDCMRRRARQLEITGDYKEMEKLYTEAIRLGNTTAMNDYACYLGENQERTKARELWLKGALSGDEDCICNVNRTLDYSFSTSYAMEARKFLHFRNEVLLNARLDADSLRFPQQFGDDEQEQAEEEQEDEQEEQEST